MRARINVVLVLSLCSLLTPVCLLGQALPTAALRDSAKVLAEETISPNRVDWLPLVDHERMILTVAGPKDLYIRQEFGAGQAPFLGLFDSKGNALPDGTYSYELWITPRQKGENGKPSRHSGYLTVRGGSFINMNPVQPKNPVSRSPLKPIAAEEIIAEGTCIGPLCTTGDEGQPLTLKDEFTQLILDGDVPNIYFRDDDSGGNSGDHSWVLQAGELFSSAEFLALWDVDAFRKVLIVEGDAPANSLYLRSNGNIGLGTSTPAERLHVLADSNANTIIASENTNTGANAAGVLRAQSDTATVNFQAHGSGRTINRFGQTLAGWAEFLAPQGNGLIIGTLNNHPLILGTNNVNRLHITSGGDIGIGTTAPNSKLHVNNGDIRVSGGSFIDDGTTLNVPDYVFEPGYRLMPLDELREFVTREKHLPNVPSAEDVKKEGLNLSQVQMRLLEKLEELTLYTLKQDEELKVLRARLEELEKSN